MKKVVVCVLSVCVGLVFTATVFTNKESQNEDTQQIISFHNDNIGVGPYNFEWVYQKVKILSKY